MSTDGPREIDLSRPSAARLYDFYLGGEHNYPADRMFAADAFAICPFLPSIAKFNRGFLRRAVQYMAEQGIRQFIDIGSGVPTVDNVHQVAHRVDPDIRVAYIDNDDEAVVSSWQLLEEQGVQNAIALYGDLRAPEDVFRAIRGEANFTDSAQPPDHILRAIENNDFLDFSQPIGLLTVAVLHFIGPHDQPLDLVRRYHDALPPGSYHAASHISVTEMAPTAREQLEELEASYGNTSNPATLRTREQFAEFFDGLELVNPGIRFAVDWPEPAPEHADDPARPSMYAAVGRKP